MGIKVPEGMWSAINESTKNMTTGQWAIVRDAVEAALQWQKDNPPKPTPQQGFELRNLALAISRNYGTEEATAASCTAVVVDWVSRMYDEPEPDVLGEIADLLRPDSSVIYSANQLIIEAYMRGKKAGSK